MVTIASSALWLRAASIVTFLYALGHTLGARQSWSPSGETEVLQAMRTFQFDAMGATRTYFDFYLGFGLYISILMLLEAVLIWQLAAQDRDGGRVRPMIGALVLANLAGTLVAWRFIFILPTIFSVAVTVCLMVAFLFAGRRARPV